MKILLIEPHKSPLTIGGEDLFLFEPLALEYLAAGIPDEHEVRLLDMRLDRNLSAVLEQFSPDVVGITGYTVHLNVVRRLFHQVRQWNPEVLTVVGGHHATVVPQDFLSPDIDLVVRGEGVYPFREIVRRHDRLEDYHGIPGVAVRINGELTSVDLPEAMDLDVLPFPKRSLSSGYRREYYSEYMKPLASIRTSKGCPYRCNFCALWKIANGRYFKRAPERILEELGEIEEEFVFFADDESLVNAPRMMKLARLIKESGIRKRYYLYGRSDTISNHPELLEEWREAGLERVFIGLEFFRDSDLEYINKGATIEQNEQAIRILQGLGIDMHAAFIIRPDFDKQDFTDFRNYCRSMGLDFPAFAVLTPLPGTDLYQETKDQLLTDQPEFFDFIHTVLPTALPLEEFYRELHDLYARAVPLRATLSFLRKYRLRDLPASLRKVRPWFRRLKNAHLDYSEIGS